MGREKLFILEAKHNATTPSVVLEPSHGSSGSLMIERAGGSAAGGSAAEGSFKGTEGMASAVALEFEKELGPRPQPEQTINPVVLADTVALYGKRTSAFEELSALESLGGEKQLLWDLRVLSRDGLHKEDLSWRRKWGGKNELPHKATTPLWKLVWAASADPMLRILMVASVISLALSLAFGENKKVEWIESAAIFIAVCIVIGVTAVNDYMKEKQFRDLYAQEEKFCSVIRNGGRVEKVDVKQLVLGDIINLETGDEIPADAIVLTGHQLKIDESSLTGESDQIAKESLHKCMELYREKSGQENLNHHSIPSPIVLAGSTVTAGSGRAVVSAVGVKSQVGKLFTKLVVDTDPTPLQNKLNALARDVGMFGLVAASLVLLVLLIEYWVAFGKMPSDERPSGSGIASDMVETIVTAITIVVVAVPEGLPLAVTISLAFSVNRMLRDQNYVRRLAACETMGGASEICSDKTGTLTKNIMEVEALWNGSTLSTSVNASPTEEIPLPPAPYLAIMTHNVSINASGYLQKTLVDIADGTGRHKQMVKQVGSPTECALLQLAENIGYNYEQIRLMYEKKEPFPAGLVLTTVSEGSSGGTTPYKYLRDEEEIITFKVPFSSDRKAMTTVVRHPTDPKQIRVFIKGASEVVVRKCVQRVDADGVLQALTPEAIERIESVIITHLASMALRTICIAYKDMPIDQFSETDVFPENPHFYAFETNFICLGIAGIRDPVREEVPDAVRRCQEAGVKVRMCTGDNIETAKQIALKANIYHPEAGGLAMLGPDFYKLVGGVLCQSCRTESCPCEDATKPDAEEDDEGVSAKGGCCKRNSKRGQDAQSVRRKRVDILGNQSAFDAIADNLEVMARSQPNDKYALVTGLKARGAVVAVTGDGTNDAPALKKADVGFAMGVTGKEVAKQAADIILLDDNFESIVRAVKWGRNIYDNVRKFLQFQITVNAVAVVTAFVGAIALRGSPLSAVQLLWVNLIMDTFAALALATEMPTDKLLKRPPHSRTEYLISNVMFRNIAVQAIYQLGVILTVIFSGECWLPETEFDYDKDRVDALYPGFTIFEQRCGNGRTVRSGRRYKPFSDQEDYLPGWTIEVGPSRHYTYVFNIFVFMQVFNLANARKIGTHDYNIFSGLLSNWWWPGIVTVILLGQIVMVEFGGFALSCNLHGLNWKQWLICIAFGAGTWVVAFLAKLIPNAIIKTLPQAGVKEVNPIGEPTSLALASRGRLRMDLLRSLVTFGIVHSEQPIPLSAPLLGDSYNTRGDGYHTRGGSLLDPLLSTYKEHSAEELCRTWCGGDSSYGLLGSY